MAPLLKDQEPPKGRTRKIVADNGIVAWDEMNIDHSEIGAQHGLGEPYEDTDNPSSSAERKADFAGRIKLTDESYELKHASFTVSLRGDPVTATENTAKLITQITGKSVKIRKD